MDHVANLLNSDAFQLYQSRIDRLRREHRETLPSSLRRFDVRFRLALGTTVQFNHDVAYTRTASTRRAYALLHRLNDLWFSWEGLIKLCKEYGAAQPNARLLEPFSSDSPCAASLAGANNLIASQFNTGIKKSEQRKQDTENFISYLFESAVINGRLSQRLALLKMKISATTAEERSIDWRDGLALAYAIRNSHVHGCDGAHSGVRLISTKLALLDACVLTLLQTNLNVALSLTGAANFQERVAVSTARSTAARNSRPML
jgi:hypothetical protein